jgi:hypothetical protein
MHPHLEPAAAAAAKQVFFYVCCAADLAGRQLEHVLDGCSNMLVCWLCPSCGCSVALDDSPFCPSRVRGWALHVCATPLLCCLQDNLLPMTCTGQNWQGGLALTLVDSLDMLLLLNRRGDIQDALTKLRNALDFDKDIKVGGSRASWTRDQQQPGPGRGQPLG